MTTKRPVHSDQYPDSFYHATANALEALPQLKERISADVCIVGGGFSGINTAIELAERGDRKSVV